MNCAVTEVSTQKNYLLLLVFKNGEKRIFDMKPYLSKGIFKELLDENIFKSAHVSFDTVEWSNSADIDPEVLYQDSYLVK